MSNPFQAGEKVIFNNKLRTIYDVYDDENVSLCLLDEDDEEYKDTEEDYQTHINQLKKID